MTRRGDGPSVGLDAEKSALRARISRLRGALPDSQRASAGSAIAGLVVGLPEIAGVERVGLFASLLDEPDTRPLFDRLKRAGCALHLPRCGAARRLQWCAVGAWEDLVPGRYGVLEPAPEREPIALSELQLVMVPGVAFDAEGRRLGRGGGYYDRTFPVGAAGPVLVGLAFAFQLVEAVPAGPEDRRVDAVVTEQAIIRVVGHPTSAEGTVGPGKEGGEEASR